MKYGIIALCGGLVMACSLALSPAYAETSFTQAVKEGYQDIKDSVKENLGAYTGNDKQDALNYAEHRKADLKKYHDAVRGARDDYRKARHSEQEAYLKYHKELPEKEDIQADLQLPKADF